MEYAVGGELFNHCAVDEPLTEKETQRLMRQILDGIAFLHDKNIVHLDIKPQNILLTKTAPAHGDIKLCDFSFAKQVNQGTDIRDILGTLDYVAPEILSYEPIKKATDMWSIGVLAYVMLTGHSPFLGETKQETFLNISQINVEYPDDLFKNISSNARDFIAKLLVKDPEDRPSATEMLSHVWLKTDELTTTTTQQQQQISSRLRSPCASPIGCRRPMPKVTLVDKIDVTPSKKYRYSEEKIMERPINGRCPLLVAPPSVA
ncbi:serine/threonine-protein kinase 17A-like isoform X2 [Tubulanus polymorphus]